MVDFHAGLFLAVGAVVFAVLTAFACVAAVLVRRRIRRLRQNFRQVLAEPVCRLAEFWISPTAAPTLHARIKLARAVAAAEHAVTMAIAADAPLGDLPSLCRRLRQEASKMEYALRIGHRVSRPSAQLRVTIAQANELSVAATHIQEAALGSISGAASMSSNRLMEDVRVEALAGSAGMERLRELSH